jgi:L-alanine-DL-glutamate epimerase-like enolase superfamily enzyme
MKCMYVSSLNLQAAVEQWPLARPFRITGHTSSVADLVVVWLEKDGHVGCGEGAGVHYREDTPELALKSIELLRATIEAGLSRDSLQKLLPPGGARNALESALWDLEAKLTGRPAWQMAGLKEPQPLLTTMTCGAETPQEMAATALGYGHARAIKLKLTGEAVDAERVRAVRRACPGSWLAVDANQGFTLDFLETLMPVLVDAHVKLIEQPFPVGQETLLDGFHSPIPIAADESAQTCADIPKLIGRFDVVNIKLDKCGGLTEGLAMARAASRAGLRPMVGTMNGTSLGMAPAILIGQLCDIIDLDGPLFLRTDRDLPVRYFDGFITSPQGLWGHPENDSSMPAARLK